THKYLQLKGRNQAQSRLRRVPEGKRQKRKGKSDGRIGAINFYLSPLAFLAFCLAARPSVVRTRASPLQYSASEA
ncbi:MAG TPA: hypothetical protein VJZ91_04825, partial [Blastocatellia bacterium]|nr:hypothetical protein [Blastocatellia bacterium]